MGPVSPVVHVQCFEVGLSGPKSYKLFFLSDSSVFDDEHAVRSKESQHGSFQYAVST